MAQFPGVCGFFVFISFIFFFFVVVVVVSAHAGLSKSWIAGWETEWWPDLCYCWVLKPSGEITLQHSLTLWCCYFTTLLFHCGGY